MRIKALTDRVEMLSIGVSVAGYREMGSVSGVKVGLGAPPH